MQKSASGLSIAGLIVGILSIILSFVPCIGVFGAGLGLLGLILAFLGFKKDKDGGASTSMGMVGIILSVIAILIGIVQGYYLQQAGSEVKTSLDKDYTNCDDLFDDYKAKTVEVKNFGEKKEEDMGFGDIKNMINAGTTIGLMQKKAEDMGCLENEEFKAKWDSVKSDFD